MKLYLNSDQAPPLALFLPSLSGGGAERVMLNLARGISQHDLQVDLVLAKAEGPYLKQLPTGIKVIDLAARRTLASIPRLARYLRQRRPQALLTALNHANMAALAAKKLSGTPTRVVVSEHNELFPGKLIDKEGVLFQRLMRYTYAWADGIVAVSEGVADSLARVCDMPRCRIMVIYNPVIGEELHQRAREPLQHPWFAPGEPPVILGIGRLHQQKDFGNLIRAFALLRREQPARLIILGEGEERPALERLALELSLTEDLSLPGFVDNPYAYLAHSAAFVLSSAWEGLPTVLIEALAVGTPVVSTDCPSGPREILQNGKFGPLVPIRDSAALAKAITDILVSPVPKVPAAWLKQFTLEAATRHYLDALGVKLPEPLTAS
ncbi:MAG: glycosyltransferase [Truepera sp.]|nr:glycosyltransferase [Truepera sp.]